MQKSNEHLYSNMDFAGEMVKLKINQKRSLTIINQRNKYKINKNDLYPVKEEHFSFSYEATSCIVI